MSMPFDEALQHLPHGPEFRFLDRLVNLDPGRAGEAEYTVRGDEPFLRGHFPGQPLWPGVLLIEAAAQLAGVVAQCDPKVPPLSDLRLTAIRQAKIFGTASPGDTLKLSAQIVGRLQRLIQADVAATVNDRLVLQAQVTLSGAD
ncbi:MAG: 3-hydroxyacyl-ACP dehydratase FabZ family protein [Verrucomicrobiota bacterium]